MIRLLNRGGLMKGFVQGADRQQTTLLPECLMIGSVRAMLFARSMFSSMRWNSATSGSMASIRQRQCEQAGVAVTLPKPQTSGAKIGRPLRET
jgi:hypothetical protein